MGGLAGGLALCRSRRRLHLLGFIEADMALTPRQTR
jgi:hypothetical protein